MISTPETPMGRFLRRKPAKTSTPINSNILSIAITDVADGGEDASHTPIARRVPPPNSPPPPTLHQPSLGRGRRPSHLCPGQLRGLVLVVPTRRMFAASMAQEQNSDGDQMELRRHYQMGRLSQEETIFVSVTWGVEERRCFSQVSRQH